MQRIVVGNKISGFFQMFNGYPKLVSWGQREPSQSSSVQRSIPPSTLDWLWQQRTYHLAARQCIQHLRGAESPHSIRPQHHS
jgi:hypothetical protein